MIGYIEGTIIAQKNNWVLVKTGGIGYKVSVTREALTRISLNSPATFWTYLAVREDALDLYGFDSEVELRFFQLLLTVSGIGPKSALAVLDVAAVETLRSAIVKNNPGYLTKVSGLGKKTAEKIVLELKDKVGLESTEGSAALKGDEEALEAMRALGYSSAEARDALRKVPHEVTNSNDRLREALKLIGAR